MATRKKNTTKPKRHEGAEFAVWRATKNSNERKVSGHTRDEHDRRMKAGQRYFDTFAEASVHAICVSAEHKNAKVLIDVIISSQAAARWWGGDAAAKLFKKDPDLSVFQRVEVRATDLGGFK